jgi:glycosyltransferase involved in cell wall biosynthesis
MTLLLIGYDLRRRGGIERLGHDLQAALEAGGQRVQLLDTRRLGPGAGGRWLGRAVFLVRLAWASRRCQLLISLHAGLLRSVEPLLPRGLPRLAWLHGVEVWGTALPPLAASLRRCRGLAASSGFTRQQLLARPGPWPPVQVIHPPAALWSEATAPAPLPPGLRLLTVARLAAAERYKGHDLLIDALAGLGDGDWQWQVVGDGDDRPRLQARVERTGLAGRVTFSGAIDDDGLRQAYRRCNLLAMPSVCGERADGSWTGEGFGIAYLEAAMAGRAALACRHGGQTDLVQHGLTGWLVDADIEAITAALAEALADPDSLARRGAAARRRALEHFGRDRFQAAVAAWLNEHG